MKNEIEEGNIFIVIHGGNRDYTFLAVPNGSNISICDIKGNNYGSYFSFESFEKMALKQGGFDKLKLGKSKLTILAVS
jgi:hypothetical protein